MKQLMMMLMILSLFVLQTLSSRIENTTQDAAINDEWCYDQFGRKSRQAFEQSTCFMCLRHMFFGSSSTLNYTSYDWNRTDEIEAACAKVLQHRSNLYSTVADCHRRVKECCMAAKDCCDQQVKSRRQISLMHFNIMSAIFCPITWDGLLCFNMSKNGSTVHGVCPSYSPNFSNKNFAMKYCQYNGQWQRIYRRDKNLVVSWEPTDYRKCLDSRKSEAQLLFEQLRLALCCVSLLFLLPSLLIFLLIRSLRTQQRIRIHINLFVALALDTLLAILSLLLHTIPAYQSLIKGIKENTTCYNSISIAQRFSQSAVFFWICIEGYYLHRLLTNAFNSDKSLTLYYVSGWFGSLFVNCVYIGLRLTIPIFQLYKCWASSEGVLEWVTNGPSLLCLALNVGFFANILRILLTQIQTHPNEPSNYRRALKATFILMPLFGLQWLITMYQIDYNPDDVNTAKYVFAYRTFQSIIKGSHGLAVSLIFCMFNNEVYNAIRHCLSQHEARLPHVVKFQSKKQLASQHAAQPLKPKEASNVEHLGNHLIVKLDADNHMDNCMFQHANESDIYYERCGTAITFDG